MLYGEGTEFDGLAVLVTRYYGGTQLGTGGLIRAYGGAAAKCLEDAPGERVYPKVDVYVDIEPSHLGAIYLAVDRLGGEVADEEYDDHGNVQLEVEVEKSKVEALRNALNDATNGKMIQFRTFD